VSAANTTRLRWALWPAAAAVLLVLVWLMPLFRIVPLEATREQSAATAFDPVARVASAWAGPLREAAADAVDAAELLAALERNVADAAASYGHRLGLATSSSYLVSGKGRVTSVDARSVAVSIDDDEEAEVLIELGPVFGNAVRDGSGLFDVSDFANAQDFNAVSAEINRRVEEEVLPALAQGAEEGRSLRFAGGVEIADSSGAPELLRVVPVQVEFL
jgi:predicted lipoprotein